MKEIVVMLLCFFLSASCSAENSRIQYALENFSLDELSIYSITYTEKSDWKAEILVNTDLYLVEIGSFIGKNHGKIIGMKSGEISVVEIVSDENNQWREKTVVLNKKSRLYRESINGVETVSPPTFKKLEIQ